MANGQEVLTPEALLLPSEARQAWARPHPDCRLLLPHGNMVLVVVRFVPQPAADLLAAARFSWRKTMKILRPEEVTTFPQPRELTPEELKEAYALARAAFTADDLQRYTEVDEGVPAGQVLAEIEAAQKQADQRTE